ncbi:MAG: hypothetical protein ACRYF1_01070, partial [Janthinobacterium lividum]
YIQNTNNKVQVSVTDWYQDYPAPSDFLAVLFSCASFHEGSDSSINISGFCDKTIDDHMKQAATTAVTDRPAADKLWAQVDREVTDSAAAAALFQPKRVDFVATHVGNFTYSDQIHFLFSQAWVK